MAAPCGTAATVMVGLLPLPQRTERLPAQQPPAICSGATRRARTSLTVRIVRSTARPVPVLVRVRVRAGAAAGGAFVSVRLLTRARRSSATAKPAANQISAVTAPPLPARHGRQHRHKASHQAAILRDMTVQRHNPLALSPPARFRYRGTIEIELRHDAGWSVTMEFIADTTEQIYVRPGRDATPDTLREIEFDAVFVPPMTEWDWRNRCCCRHDRTHSRSWPAGSSAAQRPRLHLLERNRVGRLASGHQQVVRLSAAASGHRRSAHPRGLRARGARSSA